MIERPLDPPEETIILEEEFERDYTTIDDDEFERSVTDGLLREIPDIMRGLKWTD